MSKTRDYTRRVLEACSPEEVVIVDLYQPSERLDGATSKGPLGLGTSSEIVLLLPFVYKFFEGLFDGAIKEAGKDAYVSVRNLLRAKKDDDGEAMKAIESILATEGLKDERAPVVAQEIYKLVAQQ